MKARAEAALVLVEVIDNGRSLSDALPQVLKKFPDSRDSGFIQALCYGVCRWYYSLDAIAKALLDRPIKFIDHDVYYLILIGLYQLIEMRIPDYAAVGETVSATKILQKDWARNFVNGVLREYQRQADDLHADLEKNYSAFYSHPDWIINKLKKAGIPDWRAILDANNQHPPFSLRVNQQLVSRSAYMEQLEGAHLIPATTTGIVLDNPVNVLELPNFADGYVSVQDGAAQLAAELLELQPNLRVLDACAAPGGKAAHILESQPNLAELVAVDKDEDRLQTIEENLARLKLSATCVHADASDLASWWDGELFQRILLDAPCSASGVIRRHPDIKLLRRESDIPKLVLEQTHLLTTLWQTLEPGGILLYATCSIFQEENSDLVQAFLQSHADAQEEVITATWGVACAVGRQIYPGVEGMDGFYYARLKKIM